MALAVAVFFLLGALCCAGAVLLVVLLVQARRERREFGVDALGERVARDFSGHPVAPVADGHRETGAPGWTAHNPAARDW